MEDNNEFSTVFSEPSEHGDKAVNVRRRKRTVITACLAAVVLLAPTPSTLKLTGLMSSE